MTDLTPEAVRAALEKATMGPWRIGIDTDVYAEGECDTWITLGPQNFYAVALVVNEHVKSDAEVENNARLIAMAPDLAAAYLALVEENERLRKRIKAADRLAETHKAMLRMMDDALKGTGKGDMAITPDGSLGLIEAWKRDAAYRATEEKSDE